MTPHLSNHFLHRLKDFSMPLAILAGIIFWKYLWIFRSVIPYLIAGMLFFTFLKLSPKGIRFKKVHQVLAFIQLFLGGISYLTISNMASGEIGQISAQGMLICFICPAATASAVVIAMLGGNLKVGATYVLISNTGIAFIVPLIFSWIYPGQNIDFWQSVMLIFKHVAPLVFGPLAAAWFLRFIAFETHEKLAKIPQIAFWLWVLSLMIILANTVKFIIDKHCPIEDILLLSAIGLFTCIVQFAIGKYIGRKSKEADEITIGQSLGQKNTTLAIWMAQTYLNPLSSIAPASYVIWQNCFNSYQLYRHSKEEEKKEVPLQGVK